MVLHYSRKPVPHQTVPPVADGDRTAILHNVTGIILPAGQLWDRVAESELVPTGRYIRVVRHARLKRGNRS